jgi:hypothetical protein
VARRIAIAALVSLVLSTPLVRANELDDVAAEAGVDPTELRGAVLSTGETDARRYLIGVGELAAPRPPSDWIDGLLDCLAWHESRYTPTAVNPRSGAAGWLQFLPSTWRTTPWATSSIFNVQAQLAAGRWMVERGRLREWATWRLCA